MTEFFSTLTIDDLPNLELRRVADILGLEVALKLWKHFRGVNIACPSRIPRESIARYAQNHYQLNSKEVAVMVGVSKRTVDSVFSAVPAKKGKPPVQGRNDLQMSLF